VNGTLTFRNSDLALYAVPIVAAVVAGVVVAVMPWQASVVALVLLTGVLFLAVSKAALRPVGPYVWLETRISTEQLQLRLPRRLYYLGAATIGFLTVRPALAFTASDWIFFLSFGLTCIVLLTHGVDREYLIPRTITYGVVLFAIGGLISSHNAIAPIQSVSIVVRLLYLTIVWFWLGTMVLQTRKHVENALIAWVVSASLSASGAIVQFFYGNVISGGGIAWGRMTGFTPHYNSLGGLAATAFVPALMLAVDSRSLSLRTVGFVCVGLLSAGLLLCGSVGGMLAALVATIFWFTVRGIPRRAVIGLVGIFAAGYLLMSATGETSAPDPLARISRVTSEQQAATGTGGTVYTRLDGYSQAWKIIKERPLVGIGLDDASSEDVFGDKLVHNMFINPWVSAGVLGLVGILLMIGGTSALGCAAVRHAPPAERGFNAALLASIVAFVVFGMGEPILFVRYGWFPAALLVALRAQQLRVEAPQPARAPMRRSVAGYSPAG
jgi:O-antigen ligase